EQTVFPETEYDKIKTTFGMDITFVTTAKNDEEAKALFDEFGFPFARRRE
ncbi:MAG TPA: 50S ribosomal protein L5, partial [bacterium (Candidatus Stahlbacteria)]|nr:50S ribosomal protein L5 [Candidatus Stahlbacteria bacterium]